MYLLKTSEGCWLYKTPLDLARHLCRFYGWDLLQEYDTLMKIIKDIDVGKFKEDPNLGIMIYNLTTKGYE